MSLCTVLIKIAKPLELTRFFQRCSVRIWLAEIQLSDRLVTVVLNLTGHTAENHFLKIIDNDINRGLLSFRRL